MIKEIYWLTMHVFKYKDLGFITLDSWGSEKRDHGCGISNSNIYEGQ